VDDPKGSLKPGPHGGRGGGASKPRSPLVRGLQALDHLRATPATITELACVLGVNRSTAYRLVRELEQAGCVKRETASRRFLAVAGGPGVPQHSAPSAPKPAESPGTRDWGETSQQALRDLRDLVGESTMFAVPARDRMIYISFFNNDHPVGVQEAIGGARPMHASAVGKAYLSAFPLSSLDVVLGRLDYSVGTENAAKGPFQLREMIDRTRDQGYGVDCDETFVGLSCVAVPVIVNGSTLVGAAGITGLTHRFTPDRVSEFGSLLVRHLGHLEAK
jgi:DNA-binding IclR family transcriptional regulator